MNFALFCGEGSSRRLCIARCAGRGYRRGECDDACGEDGFCQFGAFFKREKALDW